MIVVNYYYQFCFQKAIRENTFHSNWCHPLKINKCFFFSFMTKDEAHSSSASEGGITNKAYLPHQGEKKEENEEGNGKGQEG